MKKKPTTWKYKVDNRMKAFGYTDYDTKTIRVNKKKHEAAKKNPKYYRAYSKKELTLVNTVVHEDLHRKHPRMTEKDVRKKAKHIVERMSKSRRQAMYKKLS
jgi:hypothetical protein